ncbi:hypothetical protein KCP74_07900 [Salmonella enterica subsp. enterica]|nr:hypothetical protein KCP74_07900 [Salmonella enterica subsp. enterica]
MAASVVILGRHKNVDAVFAGAAMVGMLCSGTDAVCQRAESGGEFAFVAFSTASSAPVSGLFDGVIIGDCHIINDDHAATDESGIDSGYRAVLMA